MRTAPKSIFQVDDKGLAYSTFVRTQLVNQTGKRRIRDIVEV